MGLFHRNENDANFAGGSRNIVESIQRHTDVDALIYRLRCGSPWIAHQAC